MMLTVPTESLDALMPLAVAIGADGRIAHAGPTLRKLCGGKTLVGRPMNEVFEMAEGSAVSPEACGKRPARLRLRFGHRPRLRGAFVDLGEAAGRMQLLNLTLHVSEWRGEAATNLSLSDFAPNDPVADMLYLIEAKSLAMAEARSLIGDLHGAAQSAEELAITDTLTGLHNRRALEQAMARLIDRGIPFALTHLDLDHFKAVNDTYGHAAGDAVLCQVARVLRESTRASDTVARVGGDEFVLLLFRLTDETGIEAIAHRIISEIEKPVMFEGQACRVSTSLGTTLSTNYDVPAPARMLADADRALYASKAAGRATHRFAEIAAETSRDEPRRALGG